MSGRLFKTFERTKDIPMAHIRDWVMTNGAHPPFVPLVVCAIW